MCLLKEVPLYTVTGVARQVPVLAVSHSDSCYLTVLGEPPPQVVVMETLIDGKSQGSEVITVL